jgi:conjugative transposon TraN protein
VKDFATTNLSIVTADGSTYAFPVEYCSTPALWIYRVPAQQNAAIETYANGILDNPANMRGIKDHAWNINSKVSGIYIKDHIIYYQLEVRNKSSIDYDIDFLRFYIRDKHKGKRTASQENELVPFYVAGNNHLVKANSKNMIVVALEKFTIPDAKYLAIELNEKNGGRHLFMRVSNRKIIRAVALPDLK